MTSKRARNLLSPLIGLAVVSALAASALVAVPAGAVAPAVETSAAAADSVTFTAALRYDRRALLRSARAISTPGSSSYRDFPTLTEAAAAFGPTRAQRTALRETAKGLGISVTFSPTGLTADLTAPLKTWTDLYGFGPALFPAPPWAILAYVDPDTGSYPGVPAALKPHVRVIFASASELVPGPGPTARHQVLSASADDTPPTNTGSPFGPGLACVNPSARPYTYSPRQLHTPYGTSALHAAGQRGAGTRIANLGEGYAYTQDFLDFAAECFEFRAPTVRFRGGPGVGIQPVPTAKNIEGDLDVQVMAAVLPETGRLDYIEVAPSADAYLALIQGMDMVMTKTSPMPDVVSMSFGECEPQLGSLDLRAVSDDHFALTGILGTTVLASSGDGGSSACGQFQADPPAGLELAAVLYPASSQWVTAVGGSRITLGAGNERVSEVAWNDTQWEGPGGGAGTGGTSVVPRPWYQKPVTAQDRRLVPDVVAHASNYPGWPLAGSAGGPLEVIPVSGTSAATPFTAANFALIAAAERRAGRGPLGFINPTLYALATSPASYKRNFFDITEGTNQRFIVAGCCEATPGYDQATGLGSLAFNELIKSIPRPSSRAR
jgi:subtilase family serine protease